MNSKFNLSINNPCSEKFENFSLTKKGGFCSSCKKEVIDFTKMSDQEILDHFEKNTTKTCGKFLENQLKTYSQISSPKHYNLPKIKGGIVGLSLVSLLASIPTLAQKKPPTIEVWKPVQQPDKAESKLIAKGRTIKGNISDDSGGLPAVSILLKNTLIGTDTDFDGNFTFPQPLKNGDILVISYLGYETQEIRITPTTKFVKTMMKEGGDTLECIIMGEVQVEQLFKSKKRKKKN